MESFLEVKGIRVKQLAGRASKLLLALSALVVIASVVAVVVSCVLAFAPKGSAEPYQTSKVNTVLQVQTDGSVLVADQRTLEVKGDASHLVLNLGMIAESPSVSVDSILLSSLDESGQIGQTAVLEKASFNPSQDSDAIPGFASYSFDLEGSQIHVFAGDFAPSLTQKVLVTMNYTLNQAVLAYRDVSELSWYAVSGTGNAPTSDASLTVTLPSPALDSSLNDQIYVWSHGPEGGKTEVADGGIITYEVDFVDVWQYADVIVDFPTQWLTSLSPEFAQIHTGELHLDSVKKSEKEWIDTWHGRSINSYLFDMVVVALFALAAVFALVMYARYGKSRDPEYTDLYSSADPSDGTVHPALVGRIWCWNRTGVNDLRAALLHLISVGAIEVSKESDASASGKASSLVAGYRLRKVSDVAASLENPIDKQTLEFLFTTVANKAKDVRVQEIRSFKRDYADKYQAAVDAWQRALDQEFAEHPYVESEGKRWQVRLVLLAAAVASIGLALFLLFSHPVNVVSGLASALVIVLVANYIPRRTIEGNNIAARSKALRNWMRDGVKEPCGQPEMTPLHQLMPYAALFEMVDPMIERAYDAYPQLGECKLDQLDDEDRHWHACYITSVLKKDAGND